tara:strand:+ start:325 stop:489 length:165 start_codon:yes stop_codon:yes gene_type:complete
MTIQQEKNANLSQRLLILLQSGVDLPEAWNQVLGNVMTYDQFVDDLYYTLTGEK